MNIKSTIALLALLTSFCTHASTISLAKLNSKEVHTYPSTEISGQLESTLQDNSESLIITVGEESYLGAKSSKVARPLLRELGVDSESRDLIKVKELPEYTFYNITSNNLPAKVNAIIGKTAIWDNARCFNALMWRLGLTDAVFGAGERSIVSLINSPFVERKEWSNLSAGDFVVIEEEDEIGHVFYMETDNIVFHKAGSPSDFPYQLVTLDELLAKGPHIETEAKVFRLKKSARETISKARRYLPFSIRKYEQTIIALEKDLSDYVVASPMYRERPSREYYQEFQSLVNLAEETAYGIETSIESDLKNLTLTKEQKFYIDLMLERLEALQYVIGPYDD